VWWKMGVSNKQFRPEEAVTVVTLRVFRSWALVRFLSFVWFLISTVELLCGWVILFGSEMEEYFCAGCNFFGQLGLGYRSRPQPSHIPCKFGENEMDSCINSDEVQDIQCGTQFTVVIKKNGEVRLLTYRLFLILSSYRFIFVAQ
jgi:hypothetical protein